MAIEFGRIETNLAEVRGRIADACGKSGRNAGDIRLIAVTKTVGIEEVAALNDLGVRDMGENRAEVVIPKIEALSQRDIDWHFIGHLQRNKVARVLSAGIRIIHSVESEKLLDVLDARAKEADEKVRVFLEVNVAGEDSKYGASASGAQSLLESALSKSGLEVVGLMTMAPFYAEAEETRPVFAGLRELRDRLAAEFGCELPELSMGMSNDFEVAVEEGATMVRVGSALFA